MKKICVLLISLLLITNIVVLYCYYNWGRVDSVTSYELKIDSLDKENELLSIENKKLNIFIDSLSEEISKTDSVIIKVDNGMRRILMILLLFLILGNSSFSQTTYPKIVQDSLVIITKEQLKLTNTIFLEHEKYSLQIPELERKLGLQQQLLLQLLEEQVAYK